MQVPEDASQRAISKHSSTVKADEQLKAIAYSLDALIPGLYFWFGPLKMRIGGSLPEKNYPGTIHSSMGLAVVLPGYHIYSTYQDSYGPR